MEKMTTQQVYEGLKKALMKDVENKDSNHDHIYGYVAGLLKGLEDWKDVKIVGDKIELVVV